MSFVPINDDHAVQAVTFSAALTAPLGGEVLSAARAAHRKWKSELPAIRTPQSFQFQLEDGNAAPSVRSTPGIEFAFLRPDGTPSWLLRFINNAIEVECTRYTRWARVWSQAERFFSDGLQVIAQTDPERRLAHIGLGVVDVFTSEAEKYDANDLLRQNELLPEAIFGFGRSWHNHIGWFEEWSGSPILHNVNVDSRSIDGGTSANSNGKVVVSITHTQEVRYLASGGLAINDDVVPQVIRPAMEKMHQGNKAVIQHLLSAEIKKKIGLEDPK